MSKHFNSFFINFYRYLHEKSIYKMKYVLPPIHAVASVIDILEEIPLVFGNF